MTKGKADVMVCPGCGSPESGAFCGQCGTELKAGACVRCHSALKPGARFCSACGQTVARVGGAASAARGPERAAAHVAAPGRDDRVARALPWAITGVFVVAIVGYLIATTNGSTPTDAVASGAPFADGGASAGAGAGTAPDISNMSPRERAGRLYDRIMRYAEEGKKDSLAFFAPMAMQTFQQLGADLDLDARYDYGRVAAETGSLDVAAAEADTILAASPTHLLGLALRARTALKRGDAKTAKAAWVAFLAAKESELKKSLPEYQAHANDITTATGLAAAAK